jgi:hypothetical protein
VVSGWCSWCVKGSPCWLYSVKGTTGQGTSSVPASGKKAFCSRRVLSVWVTTSVSGAGENCVRFGFVAMGRVVFTGVGYGASCAQCWRSCACCMEQHPPCIPLPSMHNSHTTCQMAWGTLVATICEQWLLPRAEHGCG